MESTETTVTTTVSEALVHPVRQVTTVSKYLALALFIVLPFLGGWIGYLYAPAKVVEIERVVTPKAPEIIPASPSVYKSSYLPPPNASSTGVVQVAEGLGISFEIPADWVVEPHPSPFFPPNSIIVKSPDLELGTTFPDQPVQRGVQMTISAESLEEKYDQSLWDPEAFIAFNERLLGDCSNCIVAERMLVGNELALLSVSENVREWPSDPAGGVTTSIVLVHEGQVFLITFKSSSTTRASKEMLRRVLDTIKFL